MIADGMDTSIVSHLFPRIIADWGTSIEEVTMAVTGGLVALAVGGLLAGPIADRWGRKPILMTGFVLFNLTTAGLGLSSSFMEFFGLRLIACVGLGIVMPISMTMVADWIPSAHRAQMVLLTFLGGSGGSIIGAYLAAAMIPTFGWQTMVIVAGLAPLILVPFYVLLVPEPPAMVIALGRPAKQLKRSLSFIAGNPDDVETSVSASVKTSEKNVFATLFSKVLLISTLLIWALTLLAQGTLQLVLQYLPILLQQPAPGPRLTTAESGLAVAMLGWGGIVGVLLFSFVLKWTNRFLAGIAAAMIAIISFSIITFGNFELSGLMIMLLVAGIGVASLPAITGAITAVAYPTKNRATGTGTASVWGRVGGMISGATGGALIAIGFTLQSIFAVLTIPAALIVITLLGLRAEARRRARGAQRTKATEAENT
ncbi:MFS transporter [Arthrobacter psychrochitiniphilus]|uniref:MFS transporter n=1 Tax=Arthrobacter psychrochitiniphilus TaxID=291045 RepID=UPI003F7B8731